MKNLLSSSKLIVVQKFIVPSVNATSLFISLSALRQIMTSYLRVRLFGLLYIPSFIFGDGCWLFILNLLCLFIFVVDTALTERTSRRSEVTSSPAAVSTSWTLTLQQDAKGLPRSVQLFRLCSTHT